AFRFGQVVRPELLQERLRRDERLFCRALEPLDVDGRRCEGQTPVAPGAHVEGSDFSFCLRQVA
ncbi:MAG TPA: hypothetical protein PLF81_31035, partial [Candidatus Anammoximicrobium sp.]|nr:hypothetical protein [Candidatus Anammoximicrobium sp.]